jgi:nitrogen-specific signal transduction histidine kinase/CheY-like chemotaxis protein
METRVHPALDDGIAFFFREISDRKAAQEKLQEADRRKDEFLAMLAHELRNPLAPIGAAAELLQTVKLDEERVRRTSQIIGRQVHHMTSLVDDLLDVSRLTRGLVKLENAPLDIRHGVTDAVEQVTPLIQSRRHHFSLHLPPDTTMVRGDRKRLVQVIANVLNNAAKYTQEGGNIALRVEVHAARVAIEVEDNGIGLSPELTTHAFDLFAQAERTSDRSSGGLGLGLALVKSLVELHHGTVTCESAGLGRGSKFTISLPRLEQEPGQAAQQAADSRMQQSPRSLRVMVVDDNADAAAMLAMLLEASGHQVVIAHDSRTALEQARKEAPQVCLLDIGLPDIDGNELAQRLRAQPETARALLIAVTGYGQEQDREQTLAAGFHHHLVKPVDTGKLAAIMAQAGGA